MELETGKETSHVIHSLPSEMFLQGHLANVLVPNFPNLLSLNLCGWCLGISVVTNSFLEMFIWTRV